MGHDLHMAKRIKRRRREFRDSKPWRPVPKVWRASATGEAMAAEMRAMAIIRAGYPLLFGGALF
jgi:hypothetical protein